MAAKVAIVVAALALAAAVVPSAAARRACGQTYTVAVAQHAAKTVYAGIRKVTTAERQRLTRMAQCQRVVRAVKYVHWYVHRQRELWLTRTHPFNVGVASFYNDAGPHCCGFSAPYGVADCGSDGHCYPMGTRILFCYRRCHVGVVDDHGPFIGGRDWDFSESLANATGVSSVGVAYGVRWRLIR
jgi:rare lipoprotein A (peptidoglycan hydrolase)